MTRYAVDLDGTLADTVGATLRIFNAEYGTSYSKDDITKWKFWNTLPELQHLAEAKRRDIILRMMDRTWNEGLVKPEPGATEFMHKLVAREPNVDILTGRSTKTANESIERWLRQYGFPSVRVVRVKGSGVTKALYGYDVHIDDDPNLVDELGERWPDKRLFLVDQPWNREATTGKPIEWAGRIQRIKNLQWALPSGRQVRLMRRPSTVSVRRHVRRRR